MRAAIARVLFREMLLEKTDCSCGIVSSARAKRSHRRFIEKQTTRPMKNEDGWMCAVDRRRKNLDIDFLFTLTKRSRCSLTLSLA